MTTSSSTTSTSRANVVPCPPWCAAKPSEHAFEVESGYPVQHFKHVKLYQEPTPAVCIEMAVQPDGSARTWVGVEDDEYDLTMAERTALDLRAT